MDEFTPFMIIFILVVKTYYIAIDIIINDIDSINIY
jgi:hypothetical protein